jgi:hypothetical protein
MVATLVNINTSLYISLCILSDLTRRSLGNYAVREIPLYFYVLMFPRSHGKIKEERDRSGNFNKTRRKEWRKEREEIFAYLEVPILVCSPLVGDALGLPPLWRSHSYGNLPYNITRLEKKHCSSCPPHKSLHTSYNTSDSIKCPVQLLQTMIILFIVFVESE